MSFDKNRYTDYINKICTINEANLTEEVIDSLFDELLKILPSEGKLYRYRVLNNICIDELKNRYIWFSSAKKLNDNKDCNFNINYSQQMEELISFFLTNDNYRKTLADNLYKDLHEKIPSITVKDIDDSLAMTTNNGKLLRNYDFDKFCSRYNIPAKEKEFLYSIYREFCHNNQNEEAIRKLVGNLFNKMIEIRGNTFVRSYTTSYKKDSLWAYYCDNQGICIEYDLSKINSFELKKNFIYTYKVVYGKKDKFRFVEIAKANLNDNYESRERVNYMILQQLLTKDKSWGAEEEWRTVRYFKDDKKERQMVYADIVSSIYIDYSIYNRTKTKRLISLAKKNNWEVYIRHFNMADDSYYYDAIENTDKIVNEYQKIGVKID